ncbi:hypothetical protein ACH5RR_022472 [Cinchona calisaya]|uniref:Uncharacterized protein n=1 Tax=Cinchona calisaya TaxID=153742 RepID=A0ABD2Z7W9_9GENT
MRDHLFQLLGTSSPKMERKASDTDVSWSFINVNCDGRSQNKVLRIFQLLPEMTLKPQENGCVPLRQGEVQIPSLVEYCNQIHYNSSKQQMMGMKFVSRHLGLVL